MTIKTSLGTPAVNKQRQNVLRDEDRIITDNKYKFVFYGTLTVWLISCICVLCCVYTIDPEQERETEQAKELKMIEKIEELDQINISMIKDMLLFYANSKFDFDTYYRELGPTFVWQSILFCNTLLVFGTALMCIIAIRSPAALISMISTLIMISIIYHARWYFFNDLQGCEIMLKKLLYLVGPEAMLVVLSFLILLMVTCFNGISKTKKWLKEDFRYYYTCRYLVLIGFLVYLKIASLTMFTGIVLENVIGTSVGSTAMYWIIYIGSIYMIILTYTLGRMIISTTAATYYWNTDNEQSSFEITCQKINTIFKYNFGSACCMATYTSLLYTICFGIAMRYGFTDCKLAKYSMIFYFLNLLNLDFTILFTSICGLRVFQAFTKLFNSIWKYRLLFSCQTIFFGALFILFSTNCMMLFLKWGLNEDNWVFSAISYRYLLEILSIFLPVSLVFSTIDDTRYMCTVIETLEESAASDEKSSLEKAIINEKSQILEETPSQIMEVTN